MSYTYRMGDVKRKGSDENGHGPAIFGLRMATIGIVLALLTIGLPMAYFATVVTYVIWPVFGVITGVICGCLILACLCMSTEMFRK